MIILKSFYEVLSDIILFMSCKEMLLDDSTLFVVYQQGNLKLCQNLNELSIHT